LGGLHILGTERHEARRIDNQLRGRAGRQGDPGSSQFYLSLEDDLMRIFASERISGLMERFNWEKGQPLTMGEGTLTKLLTRTIERAQKQVEAHNFDIRKRLLDYDNIMNRQRQVIYDDRREILGGENLKEEILTVLEEPVEEMLNEYAARESHPEDWDLKGLEERINRIFPFSLSDESLPEREELREEIIRGAREAYEAKEKDVGRQVMEEFVHHVFLHFTDSKWKDHLYAMDQLREGIHYRAYAQRDPLVEYQHEAYTLFEDLKKRVVEDTVQAIFHLRPVAEEMRGVFLRAPQEFLHPEAARLGGAGSPPGTPPPRGRFASRVQAGAPAQPPSVTPFRREGKKVGRNEPCSCGSGKKHKKCCGK
ncbi:SEC-C domain-containing protein, partial [candidate division NPL-UPA2 bacterium]|nr:SEC-C domain-containing protein [candidate division NPL-UPA2 bacterium]